MMVLARASQCSRLSIPVWVPLCACLFNDRLPQLRCNPTGVLRQGNCPVLSVLLYSSGMSARHELDKELDTIERNLNPRLFFRFLFQDLEGYEASTIIVQDLDAFNQVRVGGETCEVETASLTKLTCTGHFATRGWRRRERGVWARHCVWGGSDLGAWEGGETIDKL